MAVAAAPPEPTSAPAFAKFDPLAIAHLQKDLNRVSARGGVFTIVAQVGVFAVQPLTMIFMARLLTPTDFGLFAMITSVTGFILLFKDLGLSNATIQKSEITQPEVSLLFWINGAVSVCMALATLVLAPLLAWFYHQPRLLPMVMVLSIGFLVAGFAVQHQAIITRQMRFRAGDRLIVLQSLPDQAIDLRRPEQSPPLIGRAAAQRYVLNGRGFGAGGQRSLRLDVLGLCGIRGPRVATARGTAARQASTEYQSQPCKRATRLRTAQ